MEQEFELIAKTFMGLEPVLAEELTQLGANNVQIGRRMSKLFRCESVSVLTS